ncbi:hypothetical protein [Reinekea sp. G2M2-21]|uniref:hypothetical protein n=1 Tax=Reinekea sp. G2M2-21 TaxID=2788942 RepID=UPI0018AA3153|nr:hypothetical protein [Reinekea sp. G2M2-21]
MHPSEYKTMSGLKNKAVKVLESMNKLEKRKFDGLSAAYWVQNALYTAEHRFNDREAIASLVRKYSKSRRQDLAGGDSFFGGELPKRDYCEGDTIPGVGIINEIYGDQFKVGGQWFHKRCFESQVTTFHGVTT